jgi:gas vesicle protein
MAGHSQTHPYLKSYDELKRTHNRLQNYLNMYKDDISPKEKNSIQTILNNINDSIEEIPEKYHVSRWNQFNK